MPLRVVNTLFGTEPLTVHAQGHHGHKPLWAPVKEAFFATPESRLTTTGRVGLLTCNNGHGAMGMAERSFHHLGLAYTVAGRGVDPWENARDKPPALVAAMETMEEEWVLYLDSRDALLLGDPEAAVDRALEHFEGAELIFGADRMNWPPRKEFARFEEGLAAAEPGDFRYLNGGLWLGRRAFALQFFSEACRMPPAPEAPTSEQGILKQLLPLHHPRVCLDHRCRIFQNIGFVTNPILDLFPADATAP